MTFAPRMRDENRAERRGESRAGQLIMSCRVSKLGYVTAEMKDLAWSLRSRITEKGKRGGGLIGWGERPLLIAQLRVRCWARKTYPSLQSMNHHDVHACCSVAVNINIIL